MKTTSHRPSGRQVDPSRITTERVQYWKGGIMLTAQMTGEEAKRAVTEGRAFVICSQAIGALDTNGCIPI